MKTEDTTKMATWFLSFLMILVTLALLVNISNGKESMAIVRSLSMDESLAVRGFYENLRNHDLDPRGFYNYGATTNTLAYAFISFLDWFHFPHLMGSVVFTFRLLNFCALTLGLVSLVVFLKRQLKAYDFQHQSFPTFLCMAFAATFLLNKSVVTWLQVIHPDILQMSFLCVAILFCCLENIWRAALGSFFFVGLAFGTKYAAALFAPELLLFFLWRAQHEGIFKNQGWKIIGAAALSFIFGWLIFNPYQLTNFSHVLDAIAFESQHVLRGHGVAESSNPLLWFPVLFEEWGIAGSAIVLVGLVGITEKCRREYWPNRKHLDQHQKLVVIFLLYVLLGALHLGMMVRMREGRYILHIMPFLWILSFLGLTHLLQKKAHDRLFTVILVVFSLFNASQRLLEAGELSARLTSNIMKAGAMIDSRFASDTIILADEYSFLPDRFKKVTTTYEFSEKALQSVHPQLIILNKDMTGRYIWPKSGKTFADLDFTVSDLDASPRVADFLRKFLKEEASNWHVLIEAEDVFVLERN